MSIASGASSSEMSLQEPSATKKSTSKKEKATGGVNLKKSIAKKTKPKENEGNGELDLDTWSTLTVMFCESNITSDAKTAGATRSASPSSPAVNNAGAKAGDKSGEKSEVTQCKHCKKDVSESFAEAHGVQCLEQKKERARRKKEAKEAKAREAKAKEAAEAKDADGDSVMGDSQAISQPGEATPDRGVNSSKKPPKKSASKNATDGPKKSKKRKADDAADKEPKKKKLKKDEPPKPKAPKPKAPVNVEQQCGVKLDNGGECARSLTCKSHSMGAKRAVGGRSLPYDQLLAMYQKRNAAKIQKAALSAAAPLLDDEPNTGPVDSDEEKDAVMAAVARSRPAPLEQHVFIPTTRKYKYIRMKEMLGNALGARGAGGGNIFGGPRLTVGTDAAGGTDGSQGAAADTTGAEGSARKSSQSQQAQARVHQAGNAAAAQIRKASIASAGGA